MVERTSQRTWWPLAISVTGDAINVPDQHQSLRNTGHISNDAYLVENGMGLCASAKNNDRERPVQKKKAFLEYGAEIRPAISTASWLTDSPKELVVSLWEHNFSEDFSTYSDDIAHWNSPGGVKFKRDVTEAMSQHLPVRVVLANSDQPDLVRTGRAGETANDYVPRPDIVGEVVHISQDRVVFSFESSAIPLDDVFPRTTLLNRRTSTEARYWRVVDAVETLRHATLASVVSWLEEKHPGDPLGNARADLEHLTVNSPSRPHFDQARTNWRSDSKHPRDRLFKISEQTSRRTSYVPFNPSIHGHFDLQKNTNGKWEVVTIALGELAQAEAEGHAQATLPPIESDHDSRVWAMSTIAQRQGQSVFRSQLLEAYECRCAVTGSNAKSVLEAAHITPYRGPHTNRVDNGLLLRSDIHTLFDLGLVWIEDNRLNVAPSLAGTDYEAMDGKAIRLPATTSCQPNPAHLAEHARLSRKRHGLT